MKKIIFITLITITAFAFTRKKEDNTPVAQAEVTEINWISFEDAIAAQKKNPKKIMMDAYTNWCGPCKLLDRKTFHDADVVKYVNKNYYAVKFNAEGNEKIEFNGKTYSNPNYNASKANSRNSSHELSRFFKISAYPTILFLDENAEYLAPVKGYKTPKQLELFLKLFANDDYKTVKTKEEWEAYQKDFKYTFSQ